MQAIDNDFTLHNSSTGILAAVTAILCNLAGLNSQIVAAFWMILITLLIVLHFLLIHIRSEGPTHVYNNTCFVFTLNK